MVTLLLPDGGESLYSFVFHSLISFLPQGMASVIFHIPVYFITEWQKLFTVTHADRIFPLIPEHDLISTLHLLCLNLSLLGERWWVEEQVYCRGAKHIVFSDFVHISWCISAFSVVPNFQPSGYWILSLADPCSPPALLPPKPTAGLPWAVSAARPVSLGQERAADLCYGVPKASVSMHVWRSKRKLFFNLTFWAIFTIFYISLWVMLSSGFLTF